MCLILMPQFFFSSLLSNLWLKKTSHSNEMHSSIFICSLINCYLWFSTGLLTLKIYVNCNMLCSWKGKIFLCNLK